MTDTTHGAPGAADDEGLWHATHGAGPPMLVMHGGLGYDHSYLRPALDPLGRWVRLIYYDHRGNGRSPDPDDWSAVTHATWADDADRLRAQLGYERVLVFGHSYGGVLAQEYALRHPERVAGLVLCTTYPAFDYVEQVVANARARGSPAQLDALATLGTPVSDDTTFAAAVRTILPLYFHDPSAERLAAFDRVRFRVGALNRAFFGCLPGFSAVGRLDRIAAPTLVIGSADDWIAPHEHAAARLHAGIPDSELAVFQESGHFPFLEQPEEFTATVAEWLERVDPQDAARRANVRTAAGALDRA